MTTSWWPERRDIVTNVVVQKALEQNVAVLPREIVELVTGYYGPFQYRAIVVTWRERLVVYDFALGRFTDEQVELPEKFWHVGRCWETGGILGIGRRLVGVRRNQPLLLRAFPNNPPAFEELTKGQENLEAFAECGLDFLGPFRFLRDGQGYVLTATRSDLRDLGMDSGWASVKLPIMTRGILCDDRVFGFFQSEVFQTTRDGQETNLYTFDPARRTCTSITLDATANTLYAVSSRRPPSTPLGRPERSLVVKIDLATTTATLLTEFEARIDALFIVDGTLFVINTVYEINCKVHVWMLLNHGWTRTASTSWEYDGRGKLSSEAPLTLLV